MNNETLELFFSKIGLAASDVIGKYAEWHFWSAVGWILFAIIVIVFALKLFHLEFDNEGDNKNFNLLFKAIIVGIGMLIIFANAPNLFNPEAASIHQLISDVRGGQ